MIRRPVLAALVSALAVAGLAAGCGPKESTHDRTTARTEGPYLELGASHHELTYQIQISRPLAPSDPEDKALLAGLPPGTPPLAGDETWFGVFLRVQNETHESEPAATDFRIVDTEDDVYRPVALAPTNPLAYRPTVLLQPGQSYPGVDTPGYNGPINGSLVLFRIKDSSLENRPLEFKINTPLVPHHTGTIDLDV